MTHNEFHHIVQSLDALSPEQMQQLRHELDVKLASIEANPPSGQDLGSIVAMRDDAEFLDQIVEDAMRDRREQPWRLAPSE
jgi:hypothetical protein